MSRLSLGDFELPSVAATMVVRDAVAGVFHGGEDLVFGAAKRRDRRAPSRSPHLARDRRRARGRRREQLGERPPRDRVGSRAHG